MSELVLENESHCPKGWDIVHLGDVITPIKGKKPKNVGEQNDKLTIPYITIQAFKKNIFDKFTDDVKCPQCNEHDVLLVWDGARSGLVGTGVSGVIGSTLTKLFCYDINQKYLYYFLKKHYNTINKNPKGIGIPHVNPTILWNLEFPIPPLNEQKRIVSKIEELFSLLDANIEALMKVKLQLKQLKQTFLISPIPPLFFEFLIKSSFDISNFESLKKEYETQIPKEWKWKEISEVCDTITDGSHQTPPRLKSGKIMLSVRNVRDGHLDLKEISYVSENDFKREIIRCCPRKNDVLLVSIGATIGRAAMVQDESPFMIVRNVALLRPSEELDPHYLLKWIQNPYIQKIIKRMVHDTARGGLYLNKIKKIPIIIPSISKQHKIMDKLESLESTIKNCEKSLDVLLNLVYGARVSILKSAFEGKLVPQDPNDEPSEILLKRIKQEKESQIQKIIKAKSVPKRRRNSQ